MLKRVLIANRGEIAVRVVRACRTLGLESVAVHSDADRRALHVRLADHAVGIGPAAVARSYLNMDSVIGAALLAKADAVHPGYGFLAENAVFAERCAAAGLTFVGPTPESIRLMADKARARQCAIDAGVPVIPGSDGEATDDGAALAERAREIGYPIMIKASAGGGGRGMTLVPDESEFEQRLIKAMAEARSAFGDGRVYLERCIESARHVEVQVIGDGEGTVVHLGERDCSVQRRHQKLVEESPSPGLPDDMRAGLRKAAIALCEAVSYRGAGTIEFLVDLAARAFFFIEMNTRVQVEHPVSEMVTGIDIVAEQLRVAAGMGLGFAQGDVVLSGHSIECRINAEDPERNFTPTPGVLNDLILPGGPGLRVDTHCEKGMEIAPYYDSMIAKVISWGRSREEAIQRLRAALSATRIVGVPTTIPACLKVLDDDDFVGGRHHTRWFEAKYLESSGH